MPIEDIKNCVRVDDQLLTAGQPTGDQLRDVAAAGYRAVINLGLLDPRYCLPDEARLASSLGLDYRHIPVQFDAPRPEDFDAFVTAMDEYAAQCTNVGCEASGRVRRLTRTSDASGTPMTRGSDLLPAFEAPSASAPIAPARRGRHSTDAAKPR